MPSRFWRESISRLRDSRRVLTPWRMPPDRPAVCTASAHLGCLRAAIRAPQLAGTRLPVGTGAAAVRQDEKRPTRAVGRLLMSTRFAGFEPPELPTRRGTVTPML